MSQQLINRSPDLKRLRDEGYEVAVRGGYLVVHHIPYVNGARQIAFGTLVSELTISGGIAIKPNSHVIYFKGQYPCDRDGIQIEPIRHVSNPQQLSDGITVDHSFSNKPPEGYPDYYSKVAMYANIISAPAKSLDKTVTEKTFTVIPDEGNETVFNYIDTNSSRANVNLLNAKFNGQKIAIIGLGGTGSYILDQVAKTPVGEIHLFDNDLFHQHNAFRSPGAASMEQLGAQMKKVDYLFSVYSKMHKKIIVHDEHITGGNIDQLRQMTYVFICVDRNSARKAIMDGLLYMKIPFIDVGLGVEIVEDSLIGTLRVTSATAANNSHLASRVATVDNDDDAYSTNIQISDLNALNAILAVIRWKKMSGFYQDLENEFHCTYSINVAQLTNGDIAA